MKGRSFSPKIAGVLGMLAVGFAATVPMRAAAQNTCEALLSISVSPATPMAIGNTRTITLSLGAGTPIIGGTKVTINQVRYDLDCDANFPLTVPCADQGNIMNYQGDATITTSCSGVTWTSNVPAGGHAVNEIVFTPSPPIDIPDGVNPFCDVSFTVKLNSTEPTMGPGSDATPTDVEVTAGFTGTDAVCDNSVAFQGSTFTTIPTAASPTCGDGIVQPQNGETCDPPNSVPALPAGNVNRCRTDCTYCGDGILNGPETCDTGGVPNRACNPNCTGRLAKDPGSIIFDAGEGGSDRLQVNGLIRPPFPIDPSIIVVGVRLTNANGVIYEGSLPAGSLLPVGRKYKFRNRLAKSVPGGGFSEFQFSPHRQDGYRIKLVTYGDLSAATLADMTIDVLFGTGEYTHSATWTQTKRGWREVDHSN